MQLTSSYWTLFYHGLYIEFSMYFPVLVRLHLIRNTFFDFSGGGHGAFHGARFSDSAGGFSYRQTPSPHQIMQNRFIYW